MIIKSPGNNAGSAQYASKIERLAKEIDGLVVDVHEVHTQPELKELISTKEGKFILLTPSTLQVPYTYSLRSAEKFQVVDAAMTYMLPESKNVDKILLLGFGEVGKRLFEELNYNKYCVTVARSNHMLDTDFVNQFDLIINCTNEESKVGYYYGGTVIDIAGNWKTSDHVDTETIDNLPVRVVRSPQPHIITVGTIGTLTTKLLLEGM
jgi:hypothetical protein